MNPRPFHFNVWQNSLQKKKKEKKKEKKKKKNPKETQHSLTPLLWGAVLGKKKKKNYHTFKQAYLMNLKSRVIWYSKVQISI